MLSVAKGNNGVAVMVQRPVDAVAQADAEPYVDLFDQTAVDRALITVGFTTAAGDTLVMQLDVPTAERLATALEFAAKSVHDSEGPGN